jgi:pimeloyl-ACP methyl ester carboxylesterase
MTQTFHQDDERAPNERPVAFVAPQHLAVNTPAGTGFAPLFATGEWDAPQPGVKCAVILIHGRLRNADTYFKLAHHARAAAGHDSLDTLLVVPQFLATADVAAHRPAAGTLHWDWTSWMGGDNAAGAAPISSFDVLDAILERLAQRERFPSLTSIVIAGHSGGAQVVQRYAVVTRGEANVTAQGIALRYVIANPSSYVYFDALRPAADGGFAALDNAQCPGFDDWKYGLNRLPAYAQPALRDESRAELEAAYARRDVVILLGSDDCDPAHPALDTSRAAQAQGANRLERGRAHARYMQMRHPHGLNHHVYEVAGIGHDGTGIFTSPQGVAALFDNLGTNQDER